MYNRLDVLNQTEKKVLKRINDVGITSPVILQLFAHTSKNNIQKILKKLEDLGFILRPQKGLVISQDFLYKNPESHKILEMKLNTKLPIYAMSADMRI